MHNCTVVAVATSAVVLAAANVPFSGYGMILLGNNFTELLVNVTELNILSRVNTSNWNSRQF